MLSLSRAIPKVDFRELPTMRLYTPADVPSVIQGRVCRQSRLVSIVGAAAMLAMMFGVPSYLLWQAQPPMWIVVLDAVV